MRFRTRFCGYGITTLAVLTFALSGCSGKKVKTSTPELSKLEGKKVALVQIDGEPTARSIVEVALINQLVRTGNFEIIPKQDVQAAKAAVDVDPSNNRQIARKAGADYALRAKVLTFDANEKTGYSEEEVEDSRLKEETGNGKTERVYKVKRLTGHVAVELDFTDVRPGANDQTRKGVAEKSASVTAEAKTGAAHLPPRLEFLEKLTNEAFHDFFQKYQ